MGFPIGLPSTQDAAGTWQGMTPEGMQRAIGSSYMNPGIVPGPIPFKIEGTTGWSYTITACTVVAYTSTSQRLAVLIPIEAATLPVAAAPSGSSRTDTIYVDLKGVVRVAAGTAAPGSGVILGKRVIPAGATNTKSATSAWDTEYAIPSGASLGRLAHWDGTGIESWSETMPTTRFTSRFVLPTDRIVKLEQVITLSTPDAATNLPHYVALTYSFDGSTWVKRYYFQADPTRDTHFASATLTLPAGAHTLEVQSHIRSFNGGTTGVSKIYVTDSYNSGMDMSLWDMGAAR